MKRRLRRLAGAVAAGAFVLGLLPTRASAVVVAAGGGTSSTATLPLMRWANAVATIHTHYGVGDTVTSGDPFLTAVASLLFQVSALGWQILGALVGAAQGVSTVDATIHTVNPIYGKIGGVLLGTSGASSVVVVVIVAGIGMVCYQAAKGGSGVVGAVRGIFGVLIPVGILAVTVHAAAATTDPAQAATVTGSPAWAVAKVSGWTTALSGSVASLADQVTATSPSGVGDPQDQKIADCTHYIDGLEDLYAEQDTVGQAGPPSLQAADSVVLSQIWESAVMAPWVQAQFGTGALGDKAFCHLLEIQGNVSAHDQLAAMSADNPGSAYDPSGPTWSSLFLSSETTSNSAKLLGPSFANGDDDLRRNMIAWAECDWTGGGWGLDPAFTYVFTHPAKADSCDQWWTQGTTKPLPHGGDFTTNGPFDFEDQSAIVDATSQPQHDAPAARSYIEALNGHNAGLALSTSILALLSSATYGWSLGGLALGVLIGKLSLIILVACLPLFLLLAAIPSTTTRRAARRASGLILAAFTSTFLFSVLMGLLLLFIGLLQSVSGSLLGGSGTLPGLSQALVPLAALYLLRRLLRLVGMESITSIRGAVRTTAALGQAGAGAQGGTSVRPSLGPLVATLGAGRAVSALAGSRRSASSGRSSSGGRGSRGPGASTAVVVPPTWTQGARSRPPGPPPALTWNGIWQALVAPPDPSRRAPAALGRPMPRRLASGGTQGQGPGSPDRTTGRALPMPRSFPAMATPPRNGTGHPSSPPAAIPLPPAPPDPAGGGTQRPPPPTPVRP